MLSLGISQVSLVVIITVSTVGMMTHEILSLVDPLSDEERLIKSSDLTQILSDELEIPLIDLI